MRLLINCSNIKVGGGLQVGLSFLSELAKLGSSFDIRILVSKEVSSQLSMELRKKFDVRVFDSGEGYFSRIRWLGKNESEHNSDVVFSLFGPAYWRPRARHIVGFGAVWILYPDSEAYSLLPLGVRLKKRFEYFVKKQIFRYEADSFVVETDEGAQRIKRIVSKNKNVYVVGNTCSNYFISNETDNKGSRNRNDDVFRLITVSHYYPHKNLNIINKVVPYLMSKGLKVEFHLTIDEKSFLENFRGMEASVINHGPVGVSDCPKLYQDSDALFLPTLLEIFTASYPEAMASRIPILTSDKGFAKELCKTSALYFDPFDAFDIANKIEALMVDSSLRGELIKSGSARLEQFLSAEGRAIEYLSLCETEATKKDK